MKYYAVLDTNVLVSALLKNGSIPWLVGTTEGSRITSLQMWVVAQNG